MKREKFCRLLRSCAYLLFSLMVSVMLNGGVVYGYDDLTKVSSAVTYEEIEDESIYLAPLPKANEKNINSESNRNNEVTSGRKVNEDSYVNGFEGIKPANEKLSDGLLYNLREKYSFLTGDMTSSLYRFHQLGQRVKTHTIEETTAFLQAAKGISYWRTILLLALLTVPAFISVSIKKTSLLQQFSKPDSASCMENIHTPSVYVLPLSIQKLKPAKNDQSKDRKVKLPKETSIVLFAVQKIKRWITKKQTMF